MAAFSVSKALSYPVVSKPTHSGAGNYVVRSWLHVRHWDLLCQTGQCILGQASLNTHLKTCNPFSHFAFQCRRYSTKSRSDRLPRFSAEAALLNANYIGTRA